eukprot:scaffold1915_cov144-Amphora_coffeaeformis.AAC.4
MVVSHINNSSHHHENPTATTTKRHTRLLAPSSSCNHERERDENPGSSNFLVESILHDGCNYKSAKCCGFR